MTISISSTLTPQTPAPPAAPVDTSAAPDATASVGGRALHNPAQAGLSIQSTVGSERAIPQLNAPPMRLEDVVKDMAEGAAAPFTGAWHAGLGLLADPMIRVLPLETQQQNLAEAERLGWKGAGFWGSMFVGGPVAKLPIALVWKMGLAGAAMGTTYTALEQAPNLIHGYEDPKTFASDIATSATFGALTGGALAMVPPVAKVGAQVGRATTGGVIKALNKAIDLTPGGGAVRAKTQQFVKASFGHLWDWTSTSGEVVLQKAGLNGLVTQFKAARSAAALKAGELVAGMTKNFEGLSDSELQRVAFFIEKFDFTDPELFKVAEAYTNNPADLRLFVRAQREASRMIELGQAMTKAGMQVYSPEDNEFYRFALRRNYIPHRFVNPEFYQPGGAHREDVIGIVMRKTGRTREQAESWVDNFAQRIQNSNEGVVSGRFPAGTSGHYLIGRQMGLPGYETRLDRILPQYYEHVSRRLTNHIIFGPDPLTEAVKTGLKESGVDAGGTLTPEAALVQAGPVVFKEPPPKVAGMWPIIYARQRAAERAARALGAVEFKYPKAFMQLDAVADPQMKDLATKVVRGQFGMLDNPAFGGGALEWAAKTEVITKLALGAISQPSQMMSAVVRTSYKGAMRDFFRFMSRDPEVLDFAIRSSVALRHVIRESQQTLTGKETEFLDKVLFTQFDVSSRVYGAIRGAGYAEHMAQELVATVKRGEALAQANGVVKAGAQVVGVPKAIQKRIANITERFAKLGIDANEIVSQGGILSNEQLLKAAQTTSMDVNFWGDQLSLPVFYRGAYGRFLTQFKSFGFQQTKLVKDHIAKPFVKWLFNEPGGDPAPMVRFMTLMPGGGEAISDLKSLARAKERPRALVERLAENMSNAAGWGLLYDATRATDFGAAGTFGLLSGPIVSDVAKLGAAVGEAKRGKPTKIARFALEEGLPIGAYYLAPPLAPFAAAVTPALSNLLLPKRESVQ